MWRNVKCEVEWDYGKMNDNVNLFRSSTLTGCQRLLFKKLRGPCCFICLKSLRTVMNEYYNPCYILPKCCIFYIFPLLIQIEV